MGWQQLHWVCTPDLAEAAGDWLEQRGAVSVSLEDAADSPLYEPPPGATPVWPRTRVSALFPAPVEADRLDQALREAFPDIGGPARVEFLEDRAWEREWLGRFVPMQFGNRLWVCPAGSSPPPGAPSPAVVELDPGLAFGTGTHPTTGLCLRWLDSQPLSGTHCIDYGCGSGILAIAALKLGAARATAVDTDPQALVAARENAGRNGVGVDLAVCHPEQLACEPGEIVVANILAGPLHSLAPRLAALTAPGGLLALSGVLAEQSTALSEAYGEWFETRGILTDREEENSREVWSLINLIRRK